ncbi:hypothetical protein RHMOL_Rhmol03G0142100 [Rhododendron molle]|uniref:Uncharacterized protein n=1 Tax=Rhododendron molle TaxID=49168 RepID=A0ACC0PGM3_RHOML|nr:hypothetical protein RHMOL_Rhmol03G0142100 [Rhododendron molle]
MTGKCLIQIVFHLFYEKLFVLSISRSYFELISREVPLKSRFDHIKRLESSKFD